MGSSHFANGKSARHDRGSSGLRYWLNVNYMTNDTWSVSYVRNIALRSAVKLCTSSAIIFLSIKSSIWNHGHWKGNTYEMRHVCWAQMLGQLKIWPGIMKKIHRSIRVWQIVQYNQAWLPNLFRELEQLWETSTCVGRLICPEGHVSSLNKCNPHL